MGGNNIVSYRDSVGETPTQEHPANCHNCGAPLPLDGRCEYCKASHKPMPGSVIFYDNGQDIKINVDRIPGNVWTLLVLTSAIMYYLIFTLSNCAGN